ncbi:prephenate dehydratase PHA2 [Aspergillus candidus]|uniref:prephenate dehydratase n=1 Tax=Aspergillus candidus TaxID=41067 RepID=A0A2I2EYU4_ASPCN|nr:PDT-domain-containing protein [Aspergillus candidus]PLB33530.1 PDT-domain-containing protein [Aspergillus candidus]
MESSSVAFLGPVASFSHQAAAEYFGSSATLLPHVSFGDAFASVQNGTTDYAIIPCENSTNGSVVQTLDLLIDREDRYTDVKVVAEYYLTVHHCLLARKGAFPSYQRGETQIAKLYTHLQAWGQCEIFLEKYCKGVERQDVSSTSKAGEIVSKETGEQSAAIASRFAAEHHGLDVLEENIEDKDDNTTRFLVLRNAKSDSGARLPGEDSTTDATTTTQRSLFTFMVPQEAPGTLADALLIFKKHGMNITSINTRPSQQKPWKYVFLVECDMASTDQSQRAVADILCGLRQVTEQCKYLGTWANQLTKS